MARLDRRQSLRLLGAAFEAGVTHFDTARLYGYGEAESVLGSFISGRRDEVTITTKVGILPPRRSDVLRLVKPVARRAAALYPPLRKAMREYAMGLTRPGVFDVPILKRSIETSLRELRTDHVDMLLLHECRAPDLGRGELLDFLEDCKRRGLTKAYGIGTDANTARLAAAAESPLATVLQFPSSIFDRNIEAVRPPEWSYAVSHTALGPRFAVMQAQLAQGAIAPHKSSGLGIDPQDAEALGRLCLAAAMEANPNGTVLFFSTDPHRIGRNARIVQDMPLPSQVGALRALASTLRPADGDVSVAS